MFQSRSLRLTFLALAAIATAVTSASEPQKPASRLRMRTLQLRIGRDKTVVGVKPEDAENVKKYLQALKAKAAIYVVPFRQCLEAEAQFIASIGEFDHERREALVAQGHAIADSAVDRLTKAMFERPLRGEDSVMVDGVKRTIPSGIDELFLRSPRAAARQELYQALAQELSADLRTRLDNEREQSQRASREADVLTQVAALDEALLLSSEQRESFCQLLVPTWTDAWRRPETFDAFWGRAGVVSRASDAGLGPFKIPEVELAARLRPAQSETWKSLRRALDAPNSTNGVFAGAAGIPIERCLLEMSVDYVAVVCNLTDEQRAKLLWAGAVTLTRRNEEFATRNGQARMSSAAAIASFTARLFEDESPFAKVVKSRLTPTQEACLTQARTDRQEFHERAMVASVIGKFSTRVALTAAQRARLAEFFVERLSETPDADPALRPRLGQRHRLVEIQPITSHLAEFRAIFDDSQWPIVCDDWNSLEREQASLEATRLGLPEAMDAPQRAEGAGIF